MTNDAVLEYLRTQDARPFEWGATDCAQLAAGAVALFRGESLSLPAYSSETDGKRVLVALGGLEAAVSGVLGTMRRDLTNCAPGDVVFTAYHGTHALGVAVPPHFYLRIIGGRVIPVELNQALGYWSCRLS